MIIMSPISMIIDPDFEDHGTKTVKAELKYMSKLFNLKVVSAKIDPHGYQSNTYLVSLKGTLANLDAYIEEHSWKDIYTFTLSHDGTRYIATAHDTVEFR